MVRKRSRAATQSGRPRSTRRLRSTPSAASSLPSSSRTSRSRRVPAGRPARNPTLWDAIYKARSPRSPTTISTGRSNGARALRPAEPTGRRSCTRAMPRRVAVLIECLTDNRNRAAAEVRTALTRNGGSLADPGSVSYLFTRKGVVMVPAQQGARSLTGTTCSRWSSSPGPKRSTSWASRTRSSRRPPTSSRSARRSRRPGSTTTRPRHPSSRAWRCRSTSTAPGGCCGSSRPSGLRRRPECLRQRRDQRRDPRPARRG